MVNVGLKNLKKRNMAINLTPHHFDLHGKFAEQHEESIFCQGSTARMQSYDKREHYKHLNLKATIERERKVKTHLLTRTHLFRINSYGKSSQMSHGYL